MLLHLSHRVYPWTVIDSHLLVTDGTTATVVITDIGSRTHLQLAEVKLLLTDTVTAIMTAKQEIKVATNDGERGTQWRKLLQLRAKVIDLHAKEDRLHAEVMERKQGDL